MPATSAPSPSPSSPSCSPRVGAARDAFVRRGRAVQRRVAHLHRRAGAAGQATAEYVLVLLGAASVALVLLGWLARSGRIEGLLNQVFDKITAQL